MNLFNRYCLLDLSKIINNSVINLLAAADEVIRLNRCICVDLNYREHSVYIPVDEIAKVVQEFSVVFQHQIIPTESSILRTETTTTFHYMYYVCILLFNADVLSIHNSNVYIQI